MKKLFISIAAALFCICASAQDSQQPASRFFLPVDAGTTFSSQNGIDAAFYMRACLEYRFNLLKGLFITGELDTRTHPFANGGVVWGNVEAGDIAYTDVLLGPGWRFMFSERFKLAISLQGGVSNAAFKEVTPGSNEGRYILKAQEEWYPAAKAGAMFEIYINPLFDIFIAAGLPVTCVPQETMSTDPYVMFPTVSVGFSMAL